MSPVDFLAKCDVYLLTYRPGDPVPGPRSLSEAMAAGCAPVVIDRDGPRVRVEHGVSGFRSNDAGEMARQVEELVLNPGLRRRIARGARERVRAFDPQLWIDAGGVPPGVQNCEHERGEFVAHGNAAKAYSTDGSGLTDGEGGQANRTDGSLAPRQMGGKFIELP